MAVAVVRVAVARAVVFRDSTLQHQIVHTTPAD